MDDLHYVPNSYYLVDDRSGFKRRREVMRREWTGNMVWERLWEPRQPQDFVRGVRDDQSVPIPRPRSPNVFTAPDAVDPADYPSQMS